MKDKSTNLKFFYISIFVLSLIPLFDLLYPGLPLTHDGQDHVARIANFYQSLQEGIVVPRWAGNLNWGYGHPILMFLYPFSSYLASVFHFVGFSLVDSVKLVFAFCFIASGFTMFVWLRSFLGNWSGFVGAIVYLFAPYRFVDLYVRGAIGEHAAFVFPPLICLFLLRLSRKTSVKDLIGASVSIGLLILSHNAISLMFFPLIATYMVYLVLVTKNQRLIKWFFYATLLGFGMSSFFWMPAFFEGKYTLRDIVTKGEYITRFSNFSQFIFGPWSYGISGQFTVQVGVIQWIAVVLILPLSLFRVKDKLFSRLILLWLLIFIFTLFLMTSEALSIWKTITTLQKFQFPWRFLSVTVFLTAFFSASCISTLSKKHTVVVALSFIAATLFLNSFYWHAKGYLLKPDSFYQGIYNGTTDTGESAPVWSVRFMQKRPLKNIEVIGGNASIVEVSRSSTRHMYKVSTAGSARLRENTLFFPGWNVFVNGKKIPIQFQDAFNRGLITFFVEKGDNRVEVVFSETKLRLVADLISVLSIAMAIFLIVHKKKYA